MCWQHDRIWARAHDQLRKRSGHLWDTWHGFLLCDKRLPQPLVQSHPRLFTLPPWPLGASVPSFRQCCPPHHFPFSSPEISLLLCPLLFLSCHSEGVVIRELTPELVRPAPSGRQWLTLTGDEWGGRGSPHTVKTLAQWAPSWPEIYESDRAQSSLHVVAGSLIIPIFSPSFPAAKRSPWGDGLKRQISAHWCPSGWEAHLWAAVPYRTDNCLFSRLDHPSGQWTQCSVLHWSFLEACRLVPQ